MKNRIQSVVDTEYVSWLLYLPRGIERLEELGRKKQFPKNYLLAEAGSKTGLCYVVISGRVISYEYSEGGEERIYSVNEAKSVLLEENLLFGYEVPVNIRTVTDSELICISRQALLNALSENSEVALDIMQSLSMKLLSSVEQMKCINEHSAMQKVCNLLLIFAERYGVLENGEVIIREKLSQEYISSLLGLNRITVVRVIKELKEQGLVEKKKGCYCLCDVEQLMESKMIRTG
ncbi:MAG: Crp/Fnr family transcriptional regulator [Eubacteriales bacterium]|nr:Crp/Fnr family transcriptional regulator [Eubacteriales bacterium]